MKSKLRIVISTSVLLISLVLPSVSNAGITMVCYTGAVAGYGLPTLACAMNWQNFDEVAYPIGVINYVVRKIDTGATVAGPWIFAAAAKPDNRATVYVDYPPSGPGLYFLSGSGTLYDEQYDEINGYWLDYHPDTYKSDSKTATLPLL